MSASSPENESRPGDGLRLALVGCGLWGRNLLRDALALGARVWVADPDRRAREDAKAAGAEDAFDDPKHLPEVDGLIVATPASTHHEVVGKLLDRHVPIYCEKPLTLDLSEAEDLASRAGDRLFVLHVWRHHPAVAATKRLYQEGAVGAPRWMRSTRVNWTSPRTDCDPVWTLLPHDLSIFLEVTGELPPVTHATAEWWEGKPVGMITQLEGTFPCIAEVSTRYADKRREFRLHGDAGVLTYTDSSGELRLHRRTEGSREPESQLISLPTETALCRELTAVLHHLRGGPPPASGREDALLIARRMAEIRELAGI